MTSLLQRIVSIENGQTGVSNIVVVDNLQTTLDTKQDVLTAGGNISIVDNVISATNGGGDVSQSDLDTKQDVLTAGDNISIVDNVISASGGSTDTTALQSQVDTNTSDISTLQSSKQNTLTAGDNITISGNTISASGGGSGTTIDSTTDISCNTITTVGNSNIGGIINDNQPRFMAYYNISGTPSTLNARAKVPYPAVKYNIGGGTYNTSTYEYTIPVAGLYMITAGYFYTEKHIVDIVKNNRDNGILTRCEYQNNSIASFCSKSLIVFAPCVAGDKIWVQIAFGSVRPAFNANEAPEQGWQQFTARRISD